MQHIVEGQRLVGLGWKLLSMNTNQNTFQQWRDEILVKLEFANIVQYEFHCRKFELVFANMKAPLWLKIITLN